MDAAEVTQLCIRQSDGSLCSLTVDRRFLESFGIEATGEAVMLLDRDVQAKRMNDRLLLQKVLGGMRDTWTCVRCLEAVIDPLVGPPKPLVVCDREL